MELVMTGCLAVSTGCSGVCSTDDCFILDASVFSGTKPRGSNPLNPAKIKVPKYIYCKQPVLVAFLLERRIMIQLKCKGKRIRASDRYLVYRFCAGTLLSLFVAVLLLLNMEKLLRTDWEHFSLLDNGLTLSPYNFITILIATGVCALVAFLFYRYCYDSFKRLLHRQKLARMILENRWYEAETQTDSGFFTNLQGRSREKIVWFPKMYYQTEKGLLHIRCEITLGKYQDQLLRLEDKLESGLYCELTDKTLYDGYVEYTLLYDMIANRISIDEVKAEHGGLRLMKNLVWEYDKLPHALIAGGTGGGKTYFLLTIIEALLQTNAQLYILDPKNADLPVLCRL